MDILEKIVVDKHKEVLLKKSIVPIVQLENAMLFKRPTFSLAEGLRNRGAGIIAEHKRRSPSKSIINQDLSVQEVALGYQRAGACGMSVLTDGKYFGGSLDDLLLARAATGITLLRKEFIIDEYQIIEARAYGADVILLIADILSKAQIKSFSELAKSLQMEVLLEVHNQAELDRSIMPSLDLLGVNNRNLKTFEVSLETSKSLANAIPDEFVKVSESGIGNVGSIKELMQFGYQGFLIGEQFMVSDKPGERAREFIDLLTL
ncbi:MAG: indole-3-glycerol phosphate synthase TrpC [Flavobacteriales bacterium]|nr:MAG: indole-3-glycerol phosphate synthase TrpC [Flavobacteriales bacterium]